jgi:hypothetical protein
MADTQQYNGSAAFPATADVATASDTYLMPMDAKKITADASGAGKSPVNLALKKAKDLTIGIRGGIFGDFAGAVQKTVKSLYCDGTGGATHTVAAGSIQTLTSFLVGVAGAVRASLDLKELMFSSTIASGSNPIKTTALANTLNSLLIPKAWVRWETDGVGGITFQDGASVTSVTLPGASVVKINFATAFDNPYYTYSSFIWDLNTNSQVVHVPTVTAMGSTEITCGLDPATEQLAGMQIFFGRQTT